MTAITDALGSAMVMLDVVLSAMLGAYRQRGAIRPALPGQHVRGSGSAEMADIDAFRAADPQSPGERLVHVSEQHVPRLRPPDRVEQRLAAAVHPLGDRVEEQFVDGGRGVRASDCDLADGAHLGRT